MGFQTFTINIYYVQWRMDSDLHASHSTAYKMNDVVTSVAGMSVLLAPLQLRALPVYIANTD